MRLRDILLELLWHGHERVLSPEPHAEVVEAGERPISRIAHAAERRGLGLCGRGPGRRQVFGVRIVASTRRRQILGIRIVSHGSLRVADFALVGATWNDEGLPMRKLCDVTGSADRRGLRWRLLALRRRLVGCSREIRIGLPV